MTSRVLSHDEIYKRYETHHKKTLSLYVTRQDQEFVIADDVTLADLELIRSTVELVGEPGFAGDGTNTGSGIVGGVYDTQGADASTQNPLYCSSINYLYPLNQGIASSKVRGQSALNSIEHRPGLNHGWANIEIDGLTQGTSFMRDLRYTDNHIDILVPTDSGLLANRAANSAGLAHSIKLENIKLEPKIKVRTSFIGNAPKAERTARFVEDFADTDKDNLRLLNGRIKYYDEAGLGNCLIPSNMISCVVLQFLMTPRNTV